MNDPIKMCIRDRLITLAEHASNTLPWFGVAKHTGAIIKYIDLDEEGKVTLVLKYISSPPLFSA